MLNPPSNGLRDPDPLVDFFLGGHLKDKIYTKQHVYLEDLRQHFIIHECHQITPHSYAYRISERILSSDCIVGSSQSISTNIELFTRKLPLFLKFFQSSTESQKVTALNLTEGPFHTAGSRQK